MGCLQVGSLGDGVISIAGRLFAYLTVPMPMWHYSPFLLSKVLQGLRLHAQSLRAVRRWFPVFCLMPLLLDSRKLEPDVPKTNVFIA